MTNAEGKLQFQALSITQQRQMGVLCEKGKTIKNIYRSGTVNSKSFIGKILLRIK